ncbi:ABC-2 transporter permease [Spiroplasma cantharicola]|uniref:Uncharacterized protein n=1 Tax=Spiroplasma cantharicola TaxID=362837 RepID=A0A0M4JIB8_9MOLU|nr:ABC transporter permease [Spiroplasma cantharicola]ALD66316.1 hypothetical protein SCANT_v1c04060 [Spiroplasma cantharicola]
MKNKKNIFKIPFMNQIIIFKNQKVNWLIYISSLFIIFISELISSIIFTTNKNVQSTYLAINLIMIVNSIVILFITIYYSLTILFNQILDNTYKLELRYGISKRNIFFTRVIFILTILFSFLFISLIKSICFYLFFAINHKADILVYRIYISVYAWYTIFILLVFSVTILISMLLKKESTIGTIATLFSVILLVIVSSLGMISTLNSSSRIKQLNNIAINFSYSNHQYQEIQKDDEILNLYLALQESEFMSMSMQEVMAGYNTWDLEIQQSALVFKELSFEIKEIFENSNINSWENVYEFTDDYNNNFEQLAKLAKKAIKTKSDSKYKSVYNFVNKDIVNYFYYQELDLAYKPEKLNTNPELEEKIKNNYNPDEYLFTRALMNKLYYKTSDRLFEKMRISMITTDDIIAAQNLENIKNIFNPLRHITLMFQSIDYQNEVLINQIGASQMLFSSLNNIKIYSNDSQVTIKTKRYLNIEILYVFYTLISLLLIFGSYSIFIKKNNY